MLPQQGTFNTFLIGFTNLKIDKSYEMFLR